MTKQVGEGIHGQFETPDRRHGIAIVAIDEPLKFTMLKACLHYASMIDLEHWHQCLSHILSTGVIIHFWNDSLGLLRNLSKLIRVKSLATSQH